MKEHAQVRLIEIFLSLIIVIIILFFSQNLSASLYTSNKYRESLNAIANNILYKLTSLPTFSTTVNQLFSGQKDIAKYSLKESLMILLPPGTYAQLIITQYTCTNICQLVQTEKITIGSLTQTISDKGSSTILFTPYESNTNTFYIITLTIWRIAQ